MKNWTKILPFFFVEWWAKRNCETLPVHLSIGHTYHVVNPYHRVLFIKDPHQDTKEGAE